MTERPILFSGPMVRAILDGRKTQTRRVVRDMPRGYEFVEEQERGFLFEYVGITRLEVGFDTDERSAWTRCPYGAPGDRLWVRETWASPVPQCPRDRIAYQADMTSWGRADMGDGRGVVCLFPEKLFPEGPGPRIAKWTPSIHMPRWASRLTLEVVSVRVERLCSISEEDARAEGIEPSPDVPGLWRWNAGATFGGASSARAAFASLWDEINGDRAPWKGNPWVWVVEFRRMEGGR